MEENITKFILSKGFDTIWNDNNEYDIKDRNTNWVDNDQSIKSNF